MARLRQVPQSQLPMLSNSLSEQYIKRLQVGLGFTAAIPMDNPYCSCKL